jgi:hypothetical protein
VLAAGRWTAPGVSFVALATLMHEILLTRIYSVTLWYHFAFMAISVAMFGTALGAIIVYLRPGFFRPERSERHLAWSALLFSASILGSFLAYLQIPTVFARLVALPYVALAYALSTIPFVMGGICICLALTRFRGDVGRLYAADLAGAALGCLLVVLALKVTDAPTAVVIAAAFAAAGGACFAAHAGSRGLRNGAVAVTVLLALVSVAHTVLVRRHAPLLRVTSAKGALEAPALYEKWTSFSRIRVEGDPLVPRRPFGWGFSPGYEPTDLVRELDLTIDAASGTVITGFDGDLRPLEYLKHDVTNAAHHLRRDARVLVIGAGGGRDVLSALAMEQRSVLAIEINEAIVSALNRSFGDFSGHLDRHPNVRFVNDEARSHLAREPKRFDILQISLIDTWAATTAGAFALAENSLYTVEAWTIFLDRLEPTGLLSVSRWYRPRKPDEFHRLVSLAVAALEKRGVANPRDHLAVVTAPSSDEHVRVEIGTLLVSREPLPPADVDRLEELARSMRFGLVLTPRGAEDPAFEKIAAAGGRESLLHGFTSDISAPTDDRPFFFQTVRVADLFKTEAWSRGDGERSKAFLVLGVLLLTVIGLAGCCLLLPLLLTARKDVLRRSTPLFAYFAAIGFGFMFIEVAQLQRLSLFLGHPSYSLTVVLFTLLLSGGVGSLATQGRLRSVRAATSCLAVLAASILVLGALTPWSARALQDLRTPSRIAVAVALLCPAGLLMGTAFPLGMRLAEGRPSLAPWLWGINGAASVCASVLVVAVSLGAGISASYWAGAAAYAAAALAYVVAARRFLPRAT